MAENGKNKPAVDNDGWTPVWEDKPKKAGAYLVTRIKPRRTTRAFYEDGKWWSDPLHERMWPSYMIIAWKPMPAPYAGNAATFVPDVDLKAAAENGITVVRVPAYSPYAVAEYTVALMLSLNRKIPRATWRTRDGNFSLHGLLGFDMYGKTAGIIGTGKIAKKLIAILRGFGMNILAYDLYPDYNFAREHQVVYTTLDELYRSSDIISLHCPLTEQTRYLINDYSISKMKDGVMIINTGRGQLIHTNALIEGLKNKKIGSAGLDVYEEESEYFYEDRSDKIIDDDTLARLLSFNNVIVTSHQAFFTREALANIAATTLMNIKDFMEHKKLENEVRL